MSSVDDFMDGRSPQRIIAKYEGERDEDGKRHGKGKAVYEDGGEYEGQFSHGMRHGIGVYRFHDGQ